MSLPTTGRGIPFSSGTGGPSAANLPPPVVGTTITVPGATYPLYNDGGRNYAIQVQALGQSFLVTTNGDNGAGSLRQAVLDANTFGGTSTISFATKLSGQTITLANGQIELGNNVTIDVTALTNGIQINGNASSRIFQVDASVTVVLNSLTLVNGNDNGGSGAGINNQGTLTINNSSLAGNTATGFGGGIENGSILTLNQTTVTGNSSPAFIGGGIDASSATTTVINQSTITGNTETGGGGGGVLSYGGAITVNNSIVAGNSGGDVGGYYNSLTLLGTNLTSGNPLLAALGNYGGPTPTMPPLPGSPAIDAGGSAVFATDQRGYPRPVGLAADIGAVEGIYATNGPGKIKTITSLGNGSVQLSFTNVTDAVFPVLATTNLSQSVSNWVQIGFATESPVGSGQFPFTDTQATNYPQRFYRIRSP